MFPEIEMIQYINVLYIKVIYGITTSAQNGFLLSNR